jgi:hypothetical protein
LIAAISKIYLTDLAGLALYSLKLNSARNKHWNAANARPSPARMSAKKSSKVPVEAVC